MLSYSKWALWFGHPAVQTWTQSNTLRLSWVEEHVSTTFRTRTIWKKHLFLNGMHFLSISSRGCVTAWEVAARRALLPEEFIHFYKRRKAVTFKMLLFKRQVNKTTVCDFFFTIFISHSLLKYLSNIYIYIYYDWLSVTWSSWRGDFIISWKYSKISEDTSFKFTLIEVPIVPFELKK